MGEDSEDIGGKEDSVLRHFQEQPLTAHYIGSYVVERRVGDLDYMVATPDWPKRAQLCHVNKLKPYFRKHKQRSYLVSADEEATLVWLYCHEGG